VRVIAKAALPPGAASMRTLVVPGVAPAPYDAKVVAAITRATRHAARGPTTVVGIRNAAGRIYRLVHAIGVAECIALSDALEELGLVEDRRHELDRVREGCDSIYDRLDPLRA
jgi:hypothetical protein